MDCLNECLNVQVGICQMFAFQNGICYLGRADKTDGTVAEKFTNVIVYSVSSKFKFHGKIAIFDYSYLNSLVATIVV